MSIAVVSETYGGWPTTYRLRNAALEVCVVTAVGPRIIDLRVPGGENLLHVRPHELGGRDEGVWKFRGGWRLWLAPEDLATTYDLDNSPCDAVVVDDHTVRITAPPQPVAGVQKSVELALAPDAARLRVTSSIRNVAATPRTYAAWSLSVLRPGGRAFIPLDVGPPEAFSAIRRVILWSYARLDDPRYRIADSLVEVDHRAFAAATLPPSEPSSASPAVVVRRSDESKIGVDSAQGWAAYLLDDTLYVKRFPHHAGAPYPDGGATIEVYSSREFLELENLGPLVEMLPGDEIVMTEEWSLHTGVTLPETDAPALLDALAPFVY